MRRMLLLVAVSLLFPVGCRKHPEAGPTPSTVEVPAEETQPGAGLVPPSGPTAGEVAIKVVPEMAVIYVEKKGPYSGYGAALKELMDFAAAKSIAPAGAPMGIYYDDPKVVAPEECRWEALVPVKDKVEVEGAVKVKTIPAMQVAWLLHKGSPEKAGETIGRIMAWVAKEDRFAAGSEIWEAYTTAFSEKTPPEEIAYEIWVPIRARQQ